MEREFLSEGQWARVYKVKEHSGRTVVHKEYKEAIGLYTAKATAEFLSLRTLETGSAPNCYDIFFSPNPTLVLEYCPQSYLQAVRKSSWKTAVKHISDASRAIHKSHEKRILHLDIKPEHVLINSENSVRLCDFSNSVVDAPQSDMNWSTSEHNHPGTRLFAAPEQLEQQPVGPWTDVYGLGATLYYALTSQYPTGQVKVPSSYDPGIPATLDSIIFKAIAHEKTDRYQTALEFSGALDKLLQPAPSRKPLSPFSVATIWFTGAAIGLKQVLPDTPQGASGSVMVGAVFGLLAYWTQWSQGHPRQQQ